MLNICLIGAGGRMGSEILRLISAKPSIYNLTHAIISKSKTLTPQSVSNKTIISYSLDELEQSDIKPDVVIDFSSPIATISALPFCLKYNLPILIGTTGFNELQQQEIQTYSKKIPLLVSPNTSLSACLLFHLTKIAAQKLSEFDSEIIETHHRDKKDSPSGTALKIGEIIAKARNIDFQQHAIFSRHSNNIVRNKNDIGFSAIRGGSAVGTHEVFFMGDGEYISLKCDITNRTSYAIGALNAALFISKQPTGLYNMDHVLGL